MDGKIQKRGHLEIKRNGIPKDQLCPFEGSAALCGDWCPLFSEPEPLIELIIIPAGVTPEEYEAESKNPQPTGSTIINVCNQKTLIFDNFTDERTEPSA